MILRSRKRKRQPNNSVGGESGANDVSADPQRVRTRGQASTAAAEEVWRRESCEHDRYRDILREWMRVEQPEMYKCVDELIPPGAEGPVGKATVDYFVGLGAPKRIPRGGSLEAVKRGEIPTKESHSMSISCATSTPTVGTCSGNQQPIEPNFTPKLHPVDLSDRFKAQAAAEYAHDIFRYQQRVEIRYAPSSTYMDRQTDINERMRAILIDWLVEVHLKFKLDKETLFLTVHLVDRFLQMKTVKRNKLQLVGVTAMLIASKFEEIYAPEVRDFVYISDNAYTSDEVLACEAAMLQVFQWRIKSPSVLSFLNRYLKIANAQEDDAAQKDATKPSDDAPTTKGKAKGKAKGTAKGKAKGNGHIGHDSYADDGDNDDDDSDDGGDDSVGTAATQANADMLVQQIQDLLDTISRSARMWQLVGGTDVQATSARVLQSVQEHLESEPESADQHARARHAIYAHGRKLRAHQRRFDRRYRRAARRVEMICANRAGATATDEREKRKKEDERRTAEVNPRARVKARKVIAEAGGSCDAEQQGEGQGPERNSPQAFLPPMAARPPTPTHREQERTQQEWQGDEEEVAQKQLPGQEHQHQQQKKQEEQEEPEGRRHAMLMLMLASGDCDSDSEDFDDSFLDLDDDFDDRVEGDDDGDDEHVIACPVYWQFQQTALAQFLVESMLQEYSMLRYPPSMVAASAIVVARLSLALKAVTVTHKVDAEPGPATVVFMEGQSPAGGAAGAGASVSVSSSAGAGAGAGAGAVAGPLASERHGIDGIAAFCSSVGYPMRSLVPCMLQLIEHMMPGKGSGRSSNLTAVRRKFESEKQAEVARMDIAVLNPARNATLIKTILSCAEDARSKEEGKQELQKCNRNLLDNHNYSHSRALS